MAPPDIFSGNLAKSEEFLVSLALYFMGKGDNYTDGQKVTIALSYMKGGTAGQWAKRKVLQYVKDGCQSWDDFLADFQAAFSDPDPAWTARSKMDLLKQGSSSAEEYVSSFREIMDATGYGSVALIEKFERGLSKSLVDRIYTLSEMPVSLEQWMSSALKFDRQWRRREQRFRAATTQSHIQPKPPSTPAVSTNPPRQAFQSAKLPDVVPMEVDQSSKRKPGLPVCFKCRKPGHFARDCRSKFDINSLDYDSLKAHIKKELEEEAQEKEVSSEKVSPQNF